MTDSRETKYAVNIKDMCCHYGDKLALDNINLTVREREIIVVMGHSGSGKNTLFNNVLGLLKPTSGLVEVLGKEISILNQKDLYELRKNIGLLKVINRLC